MASKQKISCSIIWMIIIFAMDAKSVKRLAERRKFNCNCHWPVRGAKEDFVLLSRCFWVILPMGENFWMYFIEMYMLFDRQLTCGFFAVTRQKLHLPAAWTFVFILIYSLNASFFFFCFANDFSLRRLIRYACLEVELFKCKERNRTFHRGGV